MTLSILVEIKNVYGAEKIYPISETAKIFAEIAGTKTLTPITIERVKELGYEIQVKQKTL